MLSLYRGARIGEPLAVGFVVEQRGDAVEDGAVIGIEPCLLVAGKHVGYYGRGVDGAKRERLELEETAEPGLAVRHYEQGVLRAYAEAFGKIDARLVGYGHALDERRGLILHAYLVGPFVNVEI